MRGEEVETRSKNTKRSSSRETSCRPVPSQVKKEEKKNSCARPDVGSNAMD
jgi:hypothetical protein